jgi:hypothetical protein
VVRRKRRLAFFFFLHFLQTEVLRAQLLTLWLQKLERRELRRLAQGIGPAAIAETVEETVGVEFWSF